jgi:hypothetical protein
MIEQIKVKSKFLLTGGQLLLACLLAAGCAPRPQKMHIPITQTIAIHTPRGEELMVYYLDSATAQWAVSSLAPQLIHRPDLDHLDHPMYLFIDGRALYVTHLTNKSGLLFASMDELAKCINFEHYLDFRVEFYQGNHFVHFIVRDGETLGKLLAQPHQVDPAYSSVLEQFISFANGSCMLLRNRHKNMATWYASKEQFLVYWRRRLHYGG